MIEACFIGWSCRSMVDRKITGLEVAGSSPVTITFYIYQYNQDPIKNISFSLQSFSHLNPNEPEENKYYDLSNLRNYLSFFNLC